MNKTSAGTVVREARHGLGMTQRELAQRVGVKPSHIAYIEKGRRRPSLHLLGRLADTLGIDRWGLLLLAHPEARHLLRGVNRSAPADRSHDVWQRFASNRSLLRRHKVSRAEIALLKQISLLEQVSCPLQFLFVLNAIRLSGTADE